MKKIIAFVALLFIAGCQPPATGATRHETDAYTVAPTDCGSTIALAGNASYAVTFTAPANYAVDCRISVQNQDSTRAKTIIIAGVSSTTLYPGQSAALSNAGTWEMTSPGRWRIPSDVYVFVDNAGDDSHDCLAAGVDNACESLQHAMQIIANNLDYNGHNIILELAAGQTFQPTVSGQPALMVMNGVGHGALVIDGGGTARIDTSGMGGNDAIDTISAITQGVVLQNVVLTTGASGTTPGFGLLVQHPAVFEIGANVTFLDCGAGQIGAQDAAAIVQIGSGSTGYTIAGSAPTAWNAANGGQIIQGAPSVVNVVGNPTFSTSFALAFGNGTIYTSSTLISFTGTATGIRYIASLNGVIFTNGGGPDYFPGNSPGILAQGGQYQ